MASSQPIWAGGGGGFGATGLGSGEPPVETLLVGQTRCVVRECVGRLVVGRGMWVGRCVILDLGCLCCRLGAAFNLDRWSLPPVPACLHIYPPTIRRPTHASTTTATRIHTHPITDRPHTPNHTASSSAGCWARAGSPLSTRARTPTTPPGATSSRRF